MIKRSNKEQIILPQGIDIIYPPDFFDNLEKICNSFSKLFQGRDYNNCSTLDITFDKCVNFLMEIEQVKIMELYKSTEPKWPEYINSLTKENKLKGKEKCKKNSNIL